MAGFVDDAVGTFADFFYFAVVLEFGHGNVRFLAVIKSKKEFQRTWFDLFDSAFSRPVIWLLTMRVYRYKTAFFGAEIILFDIFLLLFSISFYNFSIFNKINLWK